MRVQFSFLHRVEVDAKVRKYVEKKIQAASKALKEEEKLSASVEIDQNKREEYIVRVVIKTAKESFRAEETGESVEECIDVIEKELQEQIRDSKEKTITLKRRGARSRKKNTVVDDAARF